MKKERIEIKGMTCGHCVKSVEQELDKLPLLKREVFVNLLNVEYNEEEVTRMQIEGAIRAAGYNVVEFTENINKYHYGYKKMAGKYRKVN